MRIVKFQAEGFKRLRVVEITPNGDVVTLAGRNGQGKSSVLDAIYAALGGEAEVPEKPVRRGAPSARIRLDLGEIIVTRKFSLERSEVIVEAASGARFPSPQRMLDDLIGRVALDPSRFLREKPPAQLEMLRKLVKVEADLDALAGLNLRDRDARAELNKAAKRLRAQAEGIADVAPDDAALADEEAILVKLTEASGANAKVIAERTRREREIERVKLLRERAAERRGAAEKFRRLAAEADLTAEGDESTASGVDEILAALPPLDSLVDPAALNEEYGTAKRNNRAIARRDDRAILIARATDAESNAAKLTEAMAAREAERAAAIGRAEFPIAGLGFGDGEVLFDGLPLSQASTAEQLRISMAIALAMSPKLKVVCIREGAFLDADALALVAEMARAAGAQVWLEDNRSTDPTAIIMEDGAVAGAAAEPAKEATS